MEEQDFTFRIMDYSPETFPMKKLGEYLIQVAKILGSPEHVHFKTIKKGSVQLVSRVSGSATSKTNERFNQAFCDDAPKDIKDTVEKLNKMLADDNTSATFTASNTHNILKFPGVNVPRAKRIGPIKERGSLVGKLAKLEGIDASKHLTLVVDGRKIGRIDTTLDIAKRLKTYLFEDVFIRLHGHGKWYRESDGQWTMDSFKVDSFEELEDKHLNEIVKEFPDLDIGWSDSENPLEDLKAVRYGDNS